MIAVKEAKGSDKPKEWKPVSRSDLLEGLSVIHLEVFSLWTALNTYRKSSKKSYRLLAYIIFTVVVVSPYLISQILCAFYIKMDLQMAIYLILNTMPPYQAFTKMGVFWFRMEEMATLFDLLREDFLTCIPPHKKSKAKEIYRSITKRSNLFCFLAFFANTMTVVTWIAMPGFDTNLEGTGRKKIIAGWYPFPYSETPYYEVVVTYESVLMVWFGLSLCPYECFLVQLLSGLCAHFTVLNHHLATLTKEDVFGKIPENHGGVNAVMNEELKKIFDDYNKLLRYGDILKDVYNVFVTIILGMVMTDLITASLHLLFTPSDALFTVNLILFFLHSLVEIALICFTSSYVERV
ncbi:uncharacterized protein, partial [Halyomorpha halys]|uniref:uncharacterized protein n=1 Tax=Halyomorpha halys TaxID=286706 RepID=UPI0006D506DA